MTFVVGVSTTVQALAYLFDVDEAVRAILKDYRLGTAAALAYGFVAYALYYAVEEHQ